MLVASQSFGDLPWQSELPVLVVSWKVENMLPVLKRLKHGCFQKIGVFLPNHPLKKRVFHEINHPFWDTPIFGNTQI